MLSAPNPRQTPESLGRVLRSEELQSRSLRAPDHAAESVALVDLARSLSSSPKTVLNVLVGKALDLCAGGSAGISILEEGDSGERHFRWHALAGAWAPYLGAVMPRDYSPCGVVLDNGAAQLMSNLSSCYDYVEKTEPSSHQLENEMPDAPLMVSGDAMRLTQVFENLLNNAAKYTDANGVIDVRMLRNDAYAVVSMTDSGIGIAPDQMESIFDLFAQAGQAGSPHSQGGLGIGLHLARRLVESHQGTLTAESAGRGSGSTFIVRLPLI